VDVLLLWKMRMLLRRALVLVSGFELGQSRLRSGPIGLRADLAQLLPKGSSHGYLMNFLLENRDNFDVTKKRSLKEINV
jgi:hypothetical protein